jgi:uncharacterized protein DUF2505
MPRSFDLAADYDDSVDEVLGAFRDEQYWQARLAEHGVDEARLDLFEVDGDGGVEVRTTLVLGAKTLPGLVTQFHRGDLRIERGEKWRRTGDGAAEAAVTGTIGGAPVDVTGTAELTPGGTGSRLVYRASVEVRIPLVGGKLENVIGQQLSQLVVAEQEFTSDWLREKG